MYKSQIFTIVEDQQETKTIAYSQVLKYICNIRMNEINYNDFIPTLPRWIISTGALVALKHWFWISALDFWYLNLTFLTITEDQQKTKTVICSQVLKYIFKTRMSEINYNDLISLLALAFWYLNLISFYHRRKSTRS